MQTIESFCRKNSQFSSKLTLKMSGSTTKTCIKILMHLKTGDKDTNTAKLDMIYKHTIYRL